MRLIMFLFKIFARSAELRLASHSRDKVHAFAPYYYIYFIITYSPLLDTYFLLIFAFFCMFFFLHHGVNQMVNLKSILKNQFTNQKSSNIDVKVFLRFILSIYLEFWSIHYDI